MIIGIDNVAREVGFAYRVFTNIMTKVIGGYIGVDNVNRRFFRSALEYGLYVYNYDMQIITDNGSYVDVEDGVWKFYLNSTCEQTDYELRIHANARIYGDFSGKTVTIVYRTEGDTTSYVSNAYCSLEFFPYRGSSNNISMYCLKNEEYTELSCVAPDGCNYIWLGAWHRCSYGTKETVLYVKSLIIDGEELVLAETENGGEIDESNII